MGKFGRYRVPSVAEPHPFLQEAPAVYVDAGSGSMIVQAAVAGAVGAGVAAKVAWRRIGGGLGRKKGQPAVDAEGTAAPAVAGDDTEQQ